jgi:uncharacterized protein (TIGR02246 family)
MAIPVKQNFQRWTLLLAFLAFSLAGAAQSAVKDEQAIRDVMQKEIEYWNAGNIEGYVSLYAPEDSVRMLWSTGAVYGRDSILAFYKKYWPKERMGQLRFSDVRMERISDKFYFTQGFFHVTFPNNPERKPVNGRFSGLMKKINGRWYLYTDHSG